MSRNLGQGEDCWFLMLPPHDIEGRTRVCTRPVGWFITYLGDCEGARHSQGRCKPEYDSFDDGRSDAVRFYDSRYPCSGPACITIDEGIAPHAEGDGIT